MPEDLPAITVFQLEEGPREIAFTVREYIGTEISYAPEGWDSLEAVEALGKPTLPEGFEFKPIQDGDALKKGMVVLSPNILGGLSYGTVDQFEDGGWYFMTPGGMMGFLDFGEDDRNAWVCGGLANINAIKKLELYE